MNAVLSVILAAALPVPAAPIATPPLGWEPCGTWICFAYFKRRLKLINALHATLLLAIYIANSWRSIKYLIFVKLLTTNLLFACDYIFQITYRFKSGFFSFRLKCAVTKT